MLSLKAFENVKNQIGFCGLWCGSCVVGNGTLGELTRRYEEIVERYGLKEWGPKDFDFGEFVKGLRSVQAVALCLGCGKGGGKDNCAIRTCALEKSLSDCSQCDQVATCRHSEDLHHMRTGGRRAGLMAKTEDFDDEELIEKWTVELKNKWPCCILFSCNR